jgi:hypothetical protein
MHAITCTVCTITVALQLFCNIKKSTKGISRFINRNKYKNKKFNEDRPEV